MVERIADFAIWEASIAQMQRRAAKGYFAISGTAIFADQRTAGNLEKFVMRRVTAAEVTQPVKFSCIARNPEMAAGSANSVRLRARSVKLTVIAARGSAFIVTRRTKFAD